MNGFDHFEAIAPLYDRIIKVDIPDRLIRLLGLPIEGRLLDVTGEGWNAWVVVDKKGLKLMMMVLSGYRLLRILL